MLHRNHLELCAITESLAFDEKVWASDDALEKGFKSSSMVLTFY